MIYQGPMQSSMFQKVMLKWIVIFIRSGNDSWPYRCQVPFPLILTKNQYIVILLITELQLGVYFFHCMMKWVKSITFRALYHHHQFSIFEDYSSFQRYLYFNYLITFANQKALKILNITQMKDRIQSNQNQV